MINFRKILLESTPLLVLTISPSAAAESMSDPTLPSAAWLAMQPDSFGATSFTEMYAAHNMQMVLISQSRTLVIIDGRIYKVGDHFNGSKILSIKSDKVLMQDASKSLKLTPAVEKRMVTSASQRKKEPMSSKLKIIVK
jgi:hypothetical protein